MASEHNGVLTGETTGEIIDIEVVRDDLAEVRVRRTPRPELAPGEVRLVVDTFALTANNITYAVFGEGLRYWDVFPAGDAGWGRVPVWGFAEVIESRSADVTVGERLYGYLPMSNEFVIEPGRADARGLTDVSAHRAGLAGAYNRYTRCAADPLYRPDREHMQMVMYPLFATSFMIDDQLSDHTGVDGSDDADPLAAVVISSASSKTSIGVAFGAHRRGLRVIGLTSVANAEFTRSLGVYDEVVTYDDLTDAGALGEIEGPAAFVDVAGNADVRRVAHTLLADGLVLSLTVGGTHWDHEPDAPSDDPLPGPEPTFFFAPTRIAERTREWGREGFDARLGEAWDEFTDWAAGWVEMRTAVGADEVIGVYLDLLAGRVDPRHGHVCRVADTFDTGGAGADEGDPAPEAREQIR